MSKRNRRNIGREVIQWLKAQYRNGASYTSGAAIRDDIVQGSGLNIPKCTAAMATAWDRQARYELADDREFVSQPTPRDRHVRKPKPETELRQRTQDDRINELLTRAKNQLRMAQAAASQPGAQRYEWDRASALKHALNILADAALVPTPDPVATQVIGANGASDNGVSNNGITDAVIHDVVRI
jgi:hypothetical protein